MRIVLYSDLQLHPYKEFSTLVGGVNDRLLDHFAVLDQIYDYLLANQIKVLFFGGDMFEARGKVDVIAAKLLAEWKYKIAKAGIQQYDVIGNHDLVDKSTTNNSIELYRHIQAQTIISKPQWFRLGKTGVLCVPFMYSLEDIRAALELPCPFTDILPENSIAIVHYGLYDVPTESHSVIRDQGYDTEGQIRLKDLSVLLERVKHVFFGHFHITTSVTPNVHFIGTPLQHKWGERSVDTRFLDIDLEKGTFKGIPTIAPKFIEYESINAINPATAVGNFCRVRIDDAAHREAVIESVKQHGARGVDVPPPKPKIQSQSRLDINMGMTFEEMGARLVEADYETKLDKSKLKQVFVNLLKDANLRSNT